MQRIELPAAFTTQTLTKVTLWDQGGTDLQRVFLYGVTLEKAGLVTSQEFTISTIAGSAPAAGAGDHGVDWHAQGRCGRRKRKPLLPQVELLCVQAGFGRQSLAGRGDLPGGILRRRRPAISAQLNCGGMPAAGIAVDAADNIYIGDNRNYRVRRVSQDGIITTVAGTGEQGYSGDGGPATSARLRNPTGVAVDGTGNLYISDCPFVRRLSPNSAVSTTACSACASMPSDRSSTIPVIAK